MRLMTLAAISILFTGIGCGPHHRTTTTTTETRTDGYGESARPLASPTLDSLIQNVQSAKSPQAEADALRALRKYETEQGMTYTVRSVDRDTGRAVAGPTVSSSPMRTEVSLFRGRDLVRTFSFLPKDPRNLALLGE